jgi:hypothetical protein
VDRQSSVQKSFSGVMLSQFSAPEPAQFWESAPTELFDIILF